eukprot:646754-Pelagomonas_calceolata.AAC.4
MSNSCCLIHQACGAIDQESSCCWPPTPFCCRPSFGLPRLPAAELRGPQDHGSGDRGGAERSDRGVSEMCNQRCTTVLETGEELKEDAQT